MQLVFWSGTGTTENIAEGFGGVHIGEYKGGPYIIMVPSYAQPKTHKATPPQVDKFLSRHSKWCCGVVGVGNRNFGHDFCLAAEEIHHTYNVPIVTTIDMWATEKNKKDIKEALCKKPIKS